jgi:hypothetical protein
MMTEINQSYQLEQDETISSIMVITNDAMYWGDLIHKEALMASRILTGVTVPDYVTLNNGQRLAILGGQPAKPVGFSEIFIPVQTVIGYHLMPPSQDPLDYDENEPNRMMTPIHVILGPFFYKANVRISTATTPKKFLEVTKATFMSVYDPEIHLPKSHMKPIHVPMALVRRDSAIFAL